LAAKRPLASDCDEWTSGFWTRISGFFGVRLPAVARVGTPSTLKNGDGSGFKKPLQIAEAKMQLAISGITRLDDWYVLLNLFEQSG
jgi:hypothetical protein